MGSIPITRSIFRLNLTWVAFTVLTRTEKRRQIRCRWLAVACVALWGCRSVPPPEVGKEPQKPAQTVSSTNQPATVAVHLPKPSNHFSIWQKLNPVWWFGNADDPEPPERYRPGKCCRNFLWHLRNPCHNFGFYVIGIADQPFTRVGRFPGEVANPNGGWNWAVCRYKRLRLPFIDYHGGRFEFYLGWRADGNFGVKFNFHKPADKPAPRPKDDRAVFRERSRLAEQDDDGGGAG